jgi:hypothetical protein
MIPVHFVKSYKMAQLLVKHKADLDAKNKDKISAIFYAPDDKTFMFFRRKGADFDLSLSDETKKYKDELLAKTRSPKIIMMLINANADINFQNENKETPLHKLIKQKATADDSRIARYIRTLVRRRADVDIRDKHELSPFHYSIKNCDVESGKWMFGRSIEVRRHLATNSWKGPMKKIIQNNKECWDKIKEAAQQLKTKQEKERAARKSRSARSKSKKKKPVKQATAKPKKVLPKRPIKSPLKKSPVKSPAPRKSPLPGPVQPKPAVPTPAPRPTTEPGKIPVKDLSS